MKLKAEIELWEAFFWGAISVCNLIKCDFLLAIIVVQL
jgi:hypothetical protein